MKRIKNFPFHTFLIIPYLCLFLYAKNTDILEFSNLYRSILVGFAITFVLFIVSFFLFSNQKIKAGVFTSFILILLFCYGIVYDWMEMLYWKDFWPFHNIHRYLLIIYLLAFIGAFIFVRITRYTFLKLTPILNILLIALLLLNSVLALTSAAKIKSKDICEFKHTLFADLNHVKNKPDIYYFILDGYASSRTLQKYYNYCNDDFITFLRNKGFYVSDSSCSNYYTTSLSLSATLNMDYHKDTDSLSLIEKIRDNKVFAVFHDMGYKINVIKSGYSVTRNFIKADNVIEIDAINEFERSILKYSILRLDDLFGYIPYYRIKNQIRKIIQFDSHLPSPKILFSHIVCPHPPFVFDKLGNKKTKDSFGDNSWEPYEAYLEQLLFMNSQVKIIVANILANYDDSNKPIIIFQSDHGPYISNKDENDIFDARSQILNAIYIGEKDSLYSRISSVNTFRYIFNYSFGLKIPLLKDSLAGKQEFISSQNFKKLIIK